MEVIQRMKDVMKKYAPEIPLVIGDVPFPGAYYINEKIELNLELLKQRYKEFKEKGITFSSLEDSIFFTFSHELGHHIDYKKTLYKTYYDANTTLYNACYYGHVDQVKEAFITFRQEEYISEVRAWDEAVPFLSNSMDRKSFEKQREFFLSTYLTVPLFDYRLNIMESKLARTLYKLLGYHEDFYLYFDSSKEWHFKEEEKLLSLNLIPYASRKEKEKSILSPQKKVLMAVFHFLLENTPFQDKVHAAFSIHPYLKKEYDFFKNEYLPIAI